MDTAVGRRGSRPSRGRHDAWTPGAACFFLGSQRPLYSSKYRNDRAPRPGTTGPNARPLTTSNYVIAEELLTGLDGPADPSFSDIPSFLRGSEWRVVVFGFLSSPLLSAPRIRPGSLSHRPGRIVAAFVLVSPRKHASLSRDTPAFESRQLSGPIGCN